MDYRKGVALLAIRPKKLQKGDTVGVIAPASPPDLEKLQRALPFLGELGLNVKVGKHVESVNGYLAGKDEERIEDIHEMFADKEVKGIICAGGGFGTARIAARLDYELVKHNPKIFWGYSDVTFLHTAIHQKTDLVTFHGPMLSSDIGQEKVYELTKQSFKQLFTETTIEYTEEVSLLEVIHEGKVTGEIIGGNLSLLVSTLGTPFEVDTRGKILFMEDVDEEPYQVDRMLNQLKMAGKIEEAAGILVCDFNNCTPKKRKRSLTLDDVVADHIASAHKPAMKGFKIGHCSPQVAIPIGVRGTLDTNSKTFIVEPGIQ
ncbi:LD-carboxypeptidase [Bacillus songklensis]|uniref:LD-carboxypeptidase n=1 Tax=Bacillus songklensis TaxID=1069116 RepID=A0ABV8B495_9BACI